MPGDTDRLAPASTPVAAALAAVGGYVDAVGYIALVRLFTAHQSGNSVGLGVAISGGDWTEAWRRGTAIVSFVAAVALGRVILEAGHRRGARWSGAVVAGTEIVLLAAATGLGTVAATGGRILPSAAGPYVAVAACLAGAMGLQTTALRRVGGGMVRTTFVTGVLSNLAESLVAGLFRRGERRSGPGPGVLACVWVCYLAGAVIGGLAEQPWHFAALLVPIAVLAAMVVNDIWTLRSPVAPGEGLRDHSV